LTRVLIGDAQPKMRLVGPVAQPYKVKWRWGLEAL